MTNYSIQHIYLDNVKKRAIFEIFPMLLRIWDKINFHLKISELSIQYTGEIIGEKGVLSSQNFLDRTTTISKYQC